MRWRFWRRDPPAEREPEPRRCGHRTIALWVHICDEDRRVHLSTQLNAEETALILGRMLRDLRASAERVAAIAQDGERAA